MNTVNKSAIVNHTCTQMYDLVNDVKNYPHFLPMCYDVEMFEETETEIKASLKIKSGFVKLDLATHNTMVKGSRVDLNLISGPFKSFTGVWLFEVESDTSCKVSLELAFVFENKFVEMALGPVFNGLANKMLGAFCKRADEIYA